MAATVVLAAGCGDGENPPAHPIAAALRELQDAFVDGDARGVCARLSETAQNGAGGLAHGSPGDCVRDIERAFGLIADGGGWQRSERPEVTAVRARSNSGTATITVGDAWSADIPLTKEDGRWKLDGFFGAGRSRERAGIASARAAPPLADGERAAVVTTRTGKPCPAIRGDTAYSIDGGCHFFASAKATPLYVLTPFGPFKFDDCDIGYAVRVDAEGRTWTEPLGVTGGGKDSGCADVRTCLDDQPVLWRGRIGVDASGTPVHRASICLDTCVGVFVGEIATRIVRQAKGWRMETVIGGGRTGFWFGGPLPGESVPKIEAVG